MTLGQRLRQARQEAGLSQRQLCGDQITRNMLSQIENGSANPSMETLRYFAARLGKPVGYFLEEAAASPNQQIMAQARTAQGAERLQLLQAYQAPDDTFDWERWLLEALCCMDLAEQAIGEEQNGYAWELLEQAERAGGKTPYYTKELARRNALLRFAIHPEQAQALEKCFPLDMQELYLHAKAALDRSDAQLCGRLLDAAPQDAPLWQFLRAESYLAQGHYENAVQHYLKAGEQQRVYPKLELCYRELGDYRMAYHYACLRAGSAEHAEETNYK